MFTNYIWVHIRLTTWQHKTKKIMGLQENILVSWLRVKFASNICTLSYNKFNVINLILQHVKHKAKFWCDIIFPDLHNCHSNQKKCQYFLLNHWVKHIGFVWIEMISDKIIYFTNSNHLFIFPITFLAHIHHNTKSATVIISNKLLSKQTHNF